jgi:LAO/AO transport system kinase
VAALAGRAVVVGITGVPGGGKSTLVNALLGVWLARGLKVAVVAIDPSSPISGGAVLGDRIRMGEHAAHPDVFIRSLSARGALGGLSRATRAAVDCFDAAGFDRVVVETVGTGQSETEIVSIADSRVVVCPPGLGDDVQAIKAGLFEIADLLAVSKGDLPLAEETAKDLREMLALRRKPRDGEWRPRVLLVSAMAHAGVDELVDAIEAHVAIVGRGRRIVAAAAPMPEAADHLERVRTMAAHDGLCTTLGITVVDGGRGSATVTMTVDARHLNFNGGAHGGALFALADSAFGLASNSRGSLATGIAASMTFEAGVREGERLVARAHETKRSRQVGFYEVAVVRVADDGREEPVARFSGTVLIKAEPYRLHRHT